MAAITFVGIESRLIKRARKKSEEWHRHTLTLAATGLTLLVGLQKGYVPAGAQALVLLKICWITLAISIVAGLFGMWGKSQSCIDAINHLREVRAEIGDAAAAAKLNAGMSFKQKRRYDVADQVFFACLLLALVSLTWFACANLG